MVRKAHSFKRRTVTRWMLSYLLATMVPLVMVLVASLATLYLNSSSVTYSNTIASSSVQRSFRDVMLRINELKAEMIVDSDFNDLRNMSDLGEMSSLDLSYHAADIRRLEQASSFVETLFLFSPKYDWFITDHNWGRISRMEDAAFLSLSQDRIDSILGSEIWDIYMYDLSENDILIVLPMTYFRSSNRNNLSVGIILSRNVLFPSFMDDFHDVVIYSESRSSVIYSLSGKYEEGSFDSSFEEMPAGSTSNIDKLVASVGDDPILGLRCIVLMDRSIFFRNYRILIAGIAAVILVAIVFGAALAGSSVRKDWQRYEAAAAASGVDMENIPDTSGDYAPFVESVSDLKAQKEALSDVITRQNRTLIMSAVGKLLNGDATVTRDTLSALGLNLVSDSFCVVIASGTAELEECLAEHFPSSLVIPFQSEYGDAFLLNMPDDDEERFRSSLQSLGNASGLDTLSASLLHNGLDSIRDSYIEAISVREYQRDHGIAFFSYSELAATTRQNAYQFPLEENMMLQKAIKSGDADKAKGIISKVIERNRENGVSPKALRFLLFSISGTIIRTINSLDERFSEVIPEISFPPILQSHNFQKSLQGVQEIIDTICYGIAAVQAPCEYAQSETYQVYQKTLAYIQENCGNSMMNVSSIADHFCISIAYLSRIFKKYHRINISEYITSYRIDHAKELLAEGRLVTEAVDECGFGSLRTFLRVFKAEEGITPGQYRASVSKEN